MDLHPVGTRTESGRGPPPSLPDCVFLTRRSDTERRFKDEKRLEFAYRLG